MLLCLVERDGAGIGSLSKYFTHVVLASDLGVVNFESLMFRSTAFEACMAIKAQILMWAMLEFPEEEHFLYLDSDMLAYSRFEELEFILPRAEILLTPHHVQDEYSFERIWDNMLRTLQCGTFNSGFIAIRRSPMATDFLRWWNGKLQEFCYKDESCGLYFEQRWLDVAISFFDFMIFREPGYNVANWNVASRSLSFSPGSGYLVNGRPLRLFHFSMVDSGRDLVYFRKYLSSDSPVFEMRQQYIQQAAGLDSAGNSRSPWSYDFYRCGDRIAPEVRRAYRDLPDISCKVSEPFCQSNAVMNSLEASLRTA